MTPKEKAKELFEMFIAHTRVFHEGIGWVNYEDSTKTCALICVDEIIKSFDKNYPYKIETENMEWTTDDDWLFELYGEFWEQVKEEIEKL